VTEKRWIRVARAYYADVQLPPLELYQIGSVYFVRDGNHRVSVARRRGQIDIDARVVELMTDVPLTPGLDDRELALRAEQSNFLRRTKLATLRPGTILDASEPGVYHKLLQHIDGHRYFLGLERGHEVPYAEAVISWYERVYLPLVEAFDRSGIMGRFTGRTQADLYLWIVEHRHYLTQACGQDPGPDAAVYSYLLQFGEHGMLATLWRRMWSLFARPAWTAGAC